MKPQLAILKQHKQTRNRGDMPGIYKCFLFNNGPKFFEEKIE